MSNVDSLLEPRTNIQLDRDGEYIRVMATVECVAGGKLQVFASSARSYKAAKAIAYALEAVALEILKAESR